MNLSVIFVCVDSRQCNTEPLCWHEVASSSAAWTREIAESLHKVGHTGVRKGGIKSKGAAAPLVFWAVPLAWIRPVLMILMFQIRISPHLQAGGR